MEEMIESGVAEEQKALEALKKKKVPFPGATRGGNVWYVKPEICMFVRDPENPLYDPRADEHPPEAMIRSVMKRGIKKAVLVTKRHGDGVNPIVVDGRKRVQCAVIGNRRLLEEGASESQLILVPIKIEEGDDADLCQTMIETNEQHVEDTILNKATKAVRLLGLGRTPKEVAEAFGLKSVNTINDWRKLLSLDSKVVEAVRKGKLAPSAAITLDGLPEEKQREALVELLASGESSPSPSTGKRLPGRKPKATAAKAKKIAKQKGKKGGSDWRSRSEINEEIGILEKAVKSDRNTDRLNALLWVRGEDL